MVNCLDLDITRCSIDTFEYVADFTTFRMSEGNLQGFLAICSGLGKYAWLQGNGFLGTYQDVTRNNVGQKPILTLKIPA